jgi:hypothetical protein
MLSLDGEVGGRGCVVHIELRAATDETLPGPRDRVSAVCAAILDTGADVTCITPEIADVLGLEAHEIEPVLTPGGPADGIDAFAHRIEIALIDGPSGRSGGRAWLPLPIRALELQLTDGPVGVLVGRDVLEWVRLTYDGPDARFFVTSDLLVVEET